MSSFHLIIDLQPDSICYSQTALQRFYLIGSTICKSTQSIDDTEATLPAAALNRETSLLSQLPRNFSRGPSILRLHSGEDDELRMPSTIRQNSLPNSPADSPTKNGALSPTLSSRRPSSFWSYLNLTDDETAGVRAMNLEELIVLGKGAFGQVTLARHKKSKAVYALKALSKREIVRQNRQMRVFREKNNLFACKDQPFIVSLHSTFKDSYRIYLLMEYVPGGNLSTLIANGPMDFPSAQFYR